MNKILDQAESLFLKFGIRSLTMDELSRSLGISKKTLYQRIPNKSDLVSAIITRFIERDKEAVREIIENSSDAIQEIRGFAKHVIQQLRKYPTNYIFELQKYYGESWKVLEAYNSDFIYTIIKENLEKGISQGLYREGMNLDIVSRLYVGKIPIITDEEVFPLKSYEREELFREFILYHLHGIVSKKGLDAIEEHFKI